MSVGAQLLAYRLTDKQIERQVIQENWYKACDDITLILKRQEGDINAINCKNKRYIKKDLCKAISGQNKKR